MKPLVTIITPVYNQKQYIEETIESVLSQDYPNLEYIVVDDGSTDGTFDVIQKYQGKVKLLRHQNMGQYATVNKAFPLSNGEIIGIVNSDDPLLPGAVTKIVDELLSHLEILVVYPDWNLIDEKGNFLKAEKTHEYNMVDMVRWQHCMPGPAAFFRRGVYEELSGRNPEYRFVADFDFWLRASLLGPFKRIPEVLATFRIHPGSITVSQKSVAMAREQAKLVNDFFARDNIPGHLQKFRNEAFSSAYYLAGIICSETAIATSAIFFLKSLMLCPFKYLGEYKSRLVGMAYCFYRFARKG